MKYDITLFNSVPASSGNTQQTIPTKPVAAAATHYSQVWGSEDWSAIVRYTGTPTGTFTLWGTTKRNPRLADDTDWVQIVDAAIVNPAGAAGKFHVQSSETEASLTRYRLKYVHASGSGTIGGEVAVGC